MPATPSWIEQIVGQPTLFITTKNLDYIRNSQEIRLLRQYAASVRIIGSDSPSYPKRLLRVWSRLLVTPIRRFPVVFVGFAPQLIVPLFRRRMRGCFLIEDFFISLYDTFVCDRQICSASSPLGRFLHWLDTRTLQKASLVVCDTNAHRNYFVEEFHKSADEMETLYLEADASIYYPRPSSRSGAFRILYFGSVLPLQGLPVILDAVRLLQSRTDMEFVVVGPIPDDMEKPAGDNITYIPWLSQEALAQEIADADLCLAGHFHGTIQKARRTIPGKAYIYEAMGKPMILGDNPATRELEHVFQVPVFYVPMGDAQALATRMLGCMKDLARQK